MPESFTVNGVPHSIAMDGWWLASDADTPHQEAPKPLPAGCADRTTPLHLGLGGVLLLMLLADFLFWGFRPGFTLALFALAVFGVAVARRDERKGVFKPALLMGFSVLPVIEHVQALSVCILLIGGLCSLAWLRVIREGGVMWIFAAFLKLIRYLPLSGLIVLFAVLRNLCGPSGTGSPLASLRAKTAWRNWAFPAGGALMLGALLISANPVLEQLIVQLFQIELNAVATIQRLFFWIGTGLLVWPLLNPPKPSSSLAFAFPNLGHKIGLNCGSVLRGLLIFNVFLAVQSTLDFSILMGGADLPVGMSYAHYAHRGAYPLLVTAMLAGVFTFAARPFLNDHRLIMPLLLLWVVQNVLLTFSAALRLDLYIAEYGLTYMRIYALIWMGLVAVGLVIVLWHVLLERSSALLLWRVSALGFGALYLCAFVNFSALIATDTIARAAHSHTSKPVDWSYLCQLGPTANKAVKQGLIAHPTLVPSPRLRSCAQQRLTRLNWRELDLRTIRTQRDASRWTVIPPFLVGSSRRIHAAVLSFMAGVMPPMPMLGRSLL